MINIFKKQYRITEDIDSNGVSSFYPERTFFGIWHRLKHEMGTTSFSSLNECNQWMGYKHVIKTNIHKVEV